MNSLVKSESHDPYVNVAVEEYLTGNMGGRVLFIWQNAHTIVIGKNQDAYAECSVDSFVTSGGKIARRLSGGGAVYHDLGNLNFSYIGDVGKDGAEIHENTGEYIKEISQMIAETIKSFGLKPEVGGRNDITIDGKKCMGAACYFKNGRYCVHGSILINTDIEKMVDYLTVSDEKLKSKAVKSVRSRVVNLSELCVDITVASMTRGLEGLVSCSDYDLTWNQLTQKPQMKQRAMHFANEDWIYGTGIRGIGYDKCYAKRFPWGGIEVRRMSSGAIKVYSDTLDYNLVVEMEERLNSLHPCDISDIEAAVEQISANR